MKGILRCPWHVEQTPSCLYDTVKNVVVCLGCGHSATLEQLRVALTEQGRVSEAPQG